MGKPDKGKAPIEKAPGSGKPASEQERPMTPPQPDKGEVTPPTTPSEKPKHPEVPMKEPGNRPKSG